MATVLVNDTCLGSARTGIGQYLTSILRHWPKDSELSLVGFYRGPFREFAADMNPEFSFPSLETLEPISLAPLETVAPAKTWRDHFSMLKPLWRDLRSLRIGRQFRRGGYSCLFEPNCVPCVAGVPTIAAMMDLSVLEMPEVHPTDRRDWWERSFRRGIEWVDHWICISQATADAMTRVLDIAPANMTVAPLASRWGSPPYDWAADAARSRLGITTKYLLYLGTIEPRKNLLRLLDAYALTPPSFRREYALLFAGMPGWGDETYWESIRRHPMASEVKTSGYLSDAQVAAAVSGAEALVYPSLYEGFGLPAIEAMALGTPVIASSIPSLKEACGDAAMLVDPFDIEGWARAMMEVIEPGSKRESMTRSGIRQAASFSWRRAAMVHQDAIARVVNNRRARSAA